MSDKTIGQKCIEKYPERIPIILHYINIPLNIINGKTPTNKLLVLKNTNINSLMAVIRRRTKLLHSEALCILVNNKIVSVNDTVFTLYQYDKDPCDDCLHITVCKEDTFGN